MPNPEKSIYAIILSSVRDFKMFNFMCSLLILLILSAVLEGYKYSYLVLNTLSTIVIIAGAYAASANKRSVIILLVLSLPWFLSEWFFMKSRSRPSRNHSDPAARLTKDWFRHRKLAAFWIVWWATLFRLSFGRKLPSGFLQDVFSQRDYASSFSGNVSGWILLKRVIGIFERMLKKMEKSLKRA